MDNRWQKFCSQTFFMWCSGLMLAVFVPVLFCVLAIGNNMDYWSDAKQTTLLFSTQVLGLLALLGAVVLTGVMYLCRNICLDQKYNWIVNVILFAVFLSIFFLNTMVSREIAYRVPADAMHVSEYGYSAGMRQPLGYCTYLSMCPNNIPISYFLGRICRTVFDRGNFPYVVDYAWMQMGCAVVTIAGFFSCLTVKKLTKKLLPLIICFLAGFLLVECSALKMIPYTDAYAVSFSVMAAYFYLLSRDSDKESGENLLLKGRFAEGRRYLFLILALVNAGLGGLIKPSVYIMIIAVMIMEIMRLRVRGWLYLLVDLLLVLALMFGIGKYKEHMIEYLGLEYNEDISTGWQYFLMLGQNETTTGVHNPQDAAILGEFQHETKEVRHKVELQRAFERLLEKGFPGAPYFFLQKLVMVFNDATFGWAGTWVESYYEGDSVLASGTSRTERLRDIYWNGRWTGAYYTICQLAWYIVIIGLPGICLMKKRNMGYDLLLLSCLGILFYQMLFEARSRYLFVFLPLLIVASVCGYEQYANLAGGFIRKHFLKAGADRE